mmetsp:Transcript_102651/g.326276  ORF Transcript_102651/g.326276 Transcript_102651/m.326276 type:complete len:203 (-) Transcript_102651:1654-2262(-)
MHLAREAYFSALTVSSAFEVAGETLTNMSVFADPPKLSCMSCVNLWFLYGITLLLEVKAIMTSPSAVRDLLISMASFCMWASTCDFFSRSEPARSQMRIFPLSCSLVSLFTLTILMTSTRWERELSLFIAVAATVRCEFPRSRRSESCPASWHSSSVKCSTATMPDFSWRTFSFCLLALGSPLLRRSTRSFRYSSSMEPMTV